MPVAQATPAGSAARRMRYSLAMPAASPSSAAPSPTDLPPLLGPDDPPPVTVIHSAGRAPVLLVCDHASAAIPARLGRLGLDETALARHIAYDIGAAWVTQALAAALDAPAVLSGYSRLVIDLNRAPDDPTAMPVISDGVVVPGNRDLDSGAAEARIAALFRPYHDTIAARLAAFRARGTVPALISIHSFTPIMRGFERPWHIGVLWDRDPRIPVPLMERLRRDPRLVVGDNQPYSGRNGHGFTIEHHAIPAGLPHVLIEIRQDLIDTRHGASEWAALLTEALKDILADPDLYRVGHDG